MDETNQKFIAEAVDLTHDALGVVKLEDGYTVFVEDLLKGETAEIEITARKKNYGFGKVIQRLTKSPFRVTPKCKHFYECGGCGLMHMDYDLQLSFKKYRIESTLKRHKLADVQVNDMIGMATPYYYRNKVEIKFHQGEKGLEAGFFQAKSHRLVNLEECHIITKKTFEIITLLKNICNELNIEAYDSETKKGCLKSALIRESALNKEIVILLNVAKEPIPQEEVLVSKLRNKIPEIVGVASTIATDESTLSNDPIRTIYGKTSISDSLNNIIYEIGLRSFFQTNTIQAEKMIQIALEYADINRKSRVIDAYCGIGAISLNASKKANKVFGIEIVRSAIQDAKRNAQVNNITNAFFEVGDVEAVLSKWKKFSFDAIFIDPPRRGCSKGFIKALVEIKVPTIVYISCDQATLCRDLEQLVQSGYEVKEITPIDMFPQTIHVESITLLSLK
ncbi:MAG: 23S rRNA (uracil(1939)-C(5))-methyltransferase RlmD [Candidatus Izemoplasmatales bacterium]|jgi:23S rRNA (uracil1939-C5)-methyltransferase|nr:23S rRNA (uracil(1939)-C(5))-methyltransferase RlmD [Candidatus Izemoplasmatales bacterium]